MSETYPFEIPSGNDLVPATSGTQSLGSVAKPFANLQVGTVNGIVPSNPSGVYLPLTGGSLSGDLSIASGLTVSGSVITKSISLPNSHPLAGPLVIDDQSNSGPMQITSYADIAILSQNQTISIGDSITPKTVSIYSNALNVPNGVINAAGYTVNSSIKTQTSGTNDIGEASTPFAYGYFDNLIVSGVAISPSGVVAIETSGVGTPLVDARDGNTQYINSITGIGTVSVYGPVDGVIEISGSSSGGGITSINGLTASAQTIVGTGNVTVTDDGSSTITISGSTWSGGIVDSNILPITASSIDIGSTGLNFRNMYANTYYGSDAGIPLFNQGPRTFYHVTPLAATTVQTLGGSAATVRATLSLPGWTNTMGYMQRIATTTATGNDAGVQGSVLQFAQTSGLTYNGPGGYYAKFRFGIFDNASVLANGGRYFVGMTSQATNVPVNADSPAGDHIGLQYCRASGSARQDTTFQLMTRNNVTTTLSGLSMEPLTNCVYDFYLNVPAIQVNEVPYIKYKLENVTSGTFVEGIQTSTIARTGIAVKPYIGVGTFPSGAANARTLNWSYIYVQSQY
jgi:hypothetical protein